MPIGTGSGVGMNDTAFGMDRASDLVVGAVDVDNKRAWR